MPLQFLRAENLTEGNALVPSSEISHVSCEIPSFSLHLSGNNHGIDRRFLGADSSIAMSNILQALSHLSFTNTL